MKRSIVAILVCVLLAAFASAAIAEDWTQSLTATGDPVEGGSWAQSFYENLEINPMLDAITSIKVTMLNGQLKTDASGRALDSFGGILGSFLTPLGSWHQTSNNGEVATAAGDSTRFLNFSVHFQGPKDDFKRFTKENKLKLHFQAFNGDKLVDNSIASFYWSNCSGANWTFCKPGPDTRPSVPEPMSMFLGCIGLSSVAGLRRLRGK